MAVKNQNAPPIRALRERIIRIIGRIGDFLCSAFGGAAHTGGLVMGGLVTGGLVIGGAGVFAAGGNKALSVFNATADGFAVDAGGNSASRGSGVIFIASSALVRAAFCRAFAISPAV